MNFLYSLSRTLLCSFFLATAGTLLANTAIEPIPRDAKWLARHEEFCRIAREKPITILFLGDSITDGWRSSGSSEIPRGKAIWDKQFAPLGAENFGISGDRTQHLLWRIEHGELAPIKPRLVVILIGTNNTGFEYDGKTPRNSPSEAIEGVEAMVESVARHLPDTRILLLALFPRDDKGPVVRDQIATINQALSQFAARSNVVFLDIGSKFLNPSGAVSKKLMPDLLHPAAAGYQVWADAILPTIEHLLATPSR